MLRHREPQARQKGCAEPEDATVQRVRKKLAWVEDLVETEMERLLPSSI